MNLSPDVSPEEVAIFKKKVKELKKYKGRGTELISLYIPPNTDRSIVTTQLTTEMSQSSNIKSPTTRKNVQSALRKIDVFLKSIDYKIGERGIAIFCGNISSQPGKSDIRLFYVIPIRKLTTRLYWCDSEFNLEPLEEMLEEDEIYGLLTIDKREATIAVLKGKKYEILATLKSFVPGKFRAGGQSARRFERIREEAVNEFFKKVAEKANDYLLRYLDKLRGIVVGGPGYAKNEFLEKELLDYRLREKLLGTVDISYTDEGGIRELIEKSEDILKDSSLMKERKIVQEFFKRAAKGKLVEYGEKAVLEALKEGRVATLLVSEGIEKYAYLFKCPNCGYEEEVVLEEDESYERKCPKCGVDMELLEESDYLEYLRELSKQYGTDFVVISRESEEGEQFFQSFGGIGALLRY